MLYKERGKLINYGKKLVEKQLTNGTGGNLSICNREEKLVAVTPSGIDYFDLTHDDLVITDMDGNIVQGDKKPTSELSLHLALYKQRPEISAVVHTHSVYATTIACLGWELPAVHYMVAFGGNKIPLAPYATFGSKELADNVANHIGSYNAILLANHGLITIANNIETAFEAAEEIEFVARVYCQAKAIGEPVILDDTEMAVNVEKFKWYGQRS